MNKRETLLWIGVGKKMFNHFNYINKMSARIFFFKKKHTYSTKIPSHFYYVIYIDVLV